MVQVITSFHEPCPTVYNFIQTFETHWPKRYKLVAYYDQDKYQRLKGSNRSSFIQSDSIPNMTAVKEYLDNPQYRRPDTWLLNAYTWAQKALVIGHTGMSSNEPFIWLDSDIVTFADVPHDLIDRVLPDDDIFMAILGREKMQNKNHPPLTETGFLAFNPRHMISKNFFLFYLNAWFSGGFKYLATWTDANVLDYTRHITQAPCYDLTSNLPMPCPGDHAFVFSILGEWMDHLKGNRKELGYSPEHPKRWWETAGIRASVENCSERAKGEDGRFNDRVRSQ